MATSLSGLFDGYVDPQQLREKQQQQFSQNLSQAVTPQAFIAQVGSNMGQQLGNFVPGMLGQKGYNEKIAAILKQVQGIEDPVEQARAAYQAFAQAGLNKEAQMMLDRLQEAKKEQLAQQKTAIDIASKQKQMNALDEGKTAKERARNKMSAFELKLRNNKQLTPEELVEAQGLATELSTASTIYDKDTGVTITRPALDVNSAYPTLSSVLNKSGANIPTTPGGVSYDKGPKAVQAEKAYNAGQKSLDESLNKMESILTSLKTSGDITTTSKSGLSNVGSYLAGTGLGQTAGRLVGSQAQTQRDALDSYRAQLFGDIKNASGIAATSLNSDKELQFWLSTLGNENSTYEARMEALNGIRNKYLTNSVSPVPEMGKQQNTGGKDPAIEAKINAVLAYNAQKGKQGTREQAIAALKSGGKIPADYK